MRLNRIFALMLSVVLLTSGMNVIAKEEVPEEVLDCINIEERVKQAEEKGHRYSYVTVGDSKVEIVNGTVRTNRWNAAAKGSSVSMYDFQTIVHQGKKAMKSTATDQSNVFIMLEGDYWDVMPGRRIAITVEYVDISLIQIKNLQVLLQILLVLHKFWSIEHLSLQTIGVIQSKC